MKEHPGDAPIFMPAADVAKVARADGQAATGPGEGAAAVVREMPRAAAAEARAARG